MDTKFIKQIPFFSHLSDEKITIVFNQFEARKFKKDEIVMNQGDPGDGMYVIIFGEVEVIRDNKTIATLKDENFFGEMALAANEPRSATIKVISEDLSTFFLSRESFDAIRHEIGNEVRSEIIRRIAEDYSK